MAGELREIALERVGLLAGGVELRGERLVVAVERLQVLRGLAVEGVECFELRGRRLPFTRDRVIRVGELPVGDFKF